MNQQLPISLDKKVKYLNQKIKQIYQSLNNNNKNNKQTNLTFKLRFITFIDDTIEKIDAVHNNQRFNQLMDTEQTRYSQTQRSNYNDNDESQSRNYKNNNENNSNNQLNNKQYFSIQKQKIQLQRKLMQYRMKQLKKQQYQIQNQKIQLSLQKQINDQLIINKKLQQKIKILGDQIDYLNKKIQEQDKQIQKIVFTNKKLHDQIQKVKEQRNRAQKHCLQLQQKLKVEQNQAIVATNCKPMKFNYKNTQGLKNIRIFTNLTNDKKNHQRFIVLELPVKLQIQKIVYVIKIGIILSNKQLFYFEQIFLYEKDTMKIYLQGENIVFEYLKRKQRVLIDAYKIIKPQIVVMLYGKGDSVMIDETK